MMRLALLGNLLIKARGHSLFFILTGEHNKCTNEANPTHALEKASVVTITNDQSLPVIKPTPIPVRAPQMAPIGIN